MSKKDNISEDNPAMRAQKELCRDTLNRGINVAGTENHVDSASGGKPHADSNNILIEFSTTVASIDAADNNKKRDVPDADHKKIIEHVPNLVGATNVEVAVEARTYYVTVKRLNTNCAVQPLAVFVSIEMPQGEASLSIQSNAHSIMANTMECHYNNICGLAAGRPVRPC